MLGPGATAVAAFFVRYASAVSTIGYVLTYIGLVLLVVSGWYGGHLVYDGADNTNEPTIR